MVDAGFNDLVRPAMYGSYHHISIVGAAPGARPSRSWWRARCARAATSSRATSTSCWIRAPLPRPDSGDLLVLHDAGAYGAAMSSNYVSLGRAPQVWWEDGRAPLISRRETLDDIVRAESDEPI